MKEKHTREGPVERLILELIDQERERRGRRYGRRRDQAVSISETEISYHGYQRFDLPYPPTRSRKLATRAAMRRFVAKHPSFCIEVDQWGEMRLYEIQSRQRELVHEAELAADRRQARAWGFPV
jgi:hypothetical protein